MQKYVRNIAQQNKPFFLVPTSKIFFCGSCFRLNENYAKKVRELSQKELNHKTMSKLSEGGL